MNPSSIFESFRTSFYDSIFTKQTETLGVSRGELFAEPVGFDGKSLAATNMLLAGHLPGPWQFQIQGIRAWSDALCGIRLDIGAKEYVSIPADLAKETRRLEWPTMIEFEPSGMFELKPPLVLHGDRAFRVVAETLHPTLVRVALVGVLKRPVE